MARQVRVRAPATSANLGPGFDCLGLALGLYLEVEVSEERGEGLEISASGEGAGQVPLGEDNAIYQAMRQVFAATGYRPGRLRLEARSQIPLASGLGSSSAALLAGLAAGLALCGGEVDRDELIRRGVEEEGHPDNVAPCALGGLAVAVVREGSVEYARLEPPTGLAAVVAVPDFSLPTQRARALLPKKVSRADAVFNLGRVGLLTAALAGGRLELLRACMEDRLHEPYRARLVPGLEEVRQAALEAGALGAALSGAGPSVLALVRGEGKGVGEAMQRTWKRRGTEARALALEVDREGLRVEIVEG
jgi:homoserine kinase